MKEAFIAGIVLVLAGLFSLISSFLNWDFFFNSRKAHFFVMIFGRTGARIFYGLLGFILFGAGIVGFLVGSGIIKN